MKYICTIIMLSGLFIGQAWGDDLGAYNDFMDRNDDGSQIFLPSYIDGIPDHDTTLPYDTELKPCEDCEKIRAILERCREFVPNDPPGIDYVDPESIKRKQLRRDIDEMIGRLE